MLESRVDVVVVELRKLVVTPIRRLKQQRGRNANRKWDRFGSTGSSTAVVDQLYRSSGSTAL